MIFFQRVIEFVTKKFTKFHTQEKKKKKGWLDFELNKFAASSGSKSHFLHTLLIDTDICIPRDRHNDP
jgi:hypothetical protein